MKLVIVLNILFFSINLLYKSEDVQFDQTDAGISTEEDETSDVMVKEQKLIEEPVNITDTIKYKFIFPDNPDFVLTAGKPVRALITFLNLNNDSKILRKIQASLHHHRKASHSIQNFSSIQYDIPLEKNVHHSVLYSFWPHHTYAERAFYLIFYALITDNDTDHHLYVYNETHLFAELPGSFFDFQLISILLLVAGLIGLLFYWIISKYFKNLLISSNKSTQKKNVEVGTKGADIEYEWLDKECLEYDKARNLRKRKAI